MSPRQQRSSEVLEQSVIAAVPFALEHVPDEEIEAYDARLAEPIGEPGPSFLGVPPAAGSETEIKTCQLWIEDNHSNGRRRRGRWWIGLRAHRELCDLEGAYLLVVLDGDDDVLGYVLVRAEVLDELLEGRWTTNGNGGGVVEESAQLPWPTVLDPADVEGADT